ncbi:hypothetical protein SBRY_160011 [Actinacidiphila bryophytorum]|uniref:Uncharacterized protein n=1 Tax=Actinacidiphila bryophytorum TaxID=1436133 RepID=A0A9W4E943_9ACTN|nr:hypothetical protein SBRY_160011 [Actinacidiphila bryophytorum]
MPMSRTRGSPPVHTVAVCRPATTWSPAAWPRSLTLTALQEAPATGDCSTVTLPSAHTASGQRSAAPSPRSSMPRTWPLRLTSRSSTRGCDPSVFASGLAVTWLRGRGRAPRGRAAPVSRAEGAAWAGATARAAAPRAVPVRTVRRAMRCLSSPMAFLPLGRPPAPGAEQCRGAWC